MPPLRNSLVVACAISLLVHTAPAADGTWSNSTSGGFWSNTANWSGGTIAELGGSANFNTLNLLADNTVHLDSSCTLNSLIFGDTTSSHGWIVDNNGVAGNILTLAGGTPTITVNALAAGKFAAITAIIDGTAGLIKDGVGQLTLGTGTSTNSTFTGGLTIKAGSVALTTGQSGANLGSGGNGTITIGDTIGSSAATLLSSGIGGAAVTYANLIQLGASSGALTIGSTTGAQASFTGGVIGTNNLILSENNAISGTLIFSTGSLNNSGTITNAGTGGVNSSTIISSQIGSNVTGLNQNSATRLVLTGTNTYTGNTTVSAGVLDIGATTALPGWDTAGKYSVASGATLAVYNAVTNANITTMLATGNFAAGAALGFDTITANRTYSAVLANTGSGALGLTKLGINTLTLDQSNTYTGGTTVQAGTLSFANGSLGSSGNITVNGGTLQWNGSNTQDISSRLVMQTGGAATLDTNGNSVTLTSGFGGSTSSTITKVGAGTLALTGANTYTGTTTVSAGTLQFGKTASLYNGTTASWTATRLNVKSGGTIAFNVGGTGEFTTGNVTTLLTNLAASASATNGMNAGSNLGFDTTNASGANFTIVDIIANTTGASGGSRGLTKLGAGTLTLTGNNTYTGATLVSVGTLVIDGSLAAGSAVSVAGNAVMGGSGTVGGSVTTAAATSVLDPSGTGGAGIGKLTLGSLNATSGGLFRFTLGANTLAGTTYDQLAVTGLLTGSASSGALHFNFTDAGAQTGANYTLLTFGSQSGLDVADFTIDTAGWAGTFAVNANDVTVNFTSVIPEPATWALLAFSLTTVVILRRRKA